MCNAGDPIRFLGWEDPLEKGKLSTPVFWPGEFHGLHGVAKSWTLLSDFHFHFSKLRKVGHMSIREINISSKAIKHTHTHTHSIRS